MDAHVRPRNRKTQTQTLPSLKCRGFRPILLQDIWEALQAFYLAVELGHWMVWPFLSQDVRLVSFIELFISYCWGLNLRWTSHGCAQQERWKHLRRVILFFFDTRYSNSLWLPILYTFVPSSIHSHMCSFNKYLIFSCKSWVTVALNCWVV